MGSAFKASAPLLTEPVPVEDTFITGIGRVERRGDFVRLHFVAEGDRMDGSACPATELAIVAKLITSPERLRRIIRQLQMAIDADRKH